MTSAAFNVSSDYLISTLDLAKPLWATKLYQPYDQIDIKEMNLLLAQSPSESVGNITGVHYELDRPTYYFQAGAIFTVAGAQNIQTGPLAAALVNADGTSAVRVGDILKDSVTMVEYQVDSKSTANPPVVTLRPINTASFSTAIPAGRNLAYISRSEKERSSAPDQVVRGTTAYQWQLQIMRDYQDLSGTAMNLELKPANLGDGKTLSGWNTVQTMDTEARVLRNMFGAYMFGASTISAQANLNISLQTAQGLDKTIQQRGWNLNIGSTAISAANMLTATANIKAQGAGEFYELLVPNKRSVEFDAIYTAQQANSLNPAMDKVFAAHFFGSAQNHEQLRGVYTWNTVYVNGINFAKKELNFLNNPTTFNVDPSTSNFQNLMYFIPVGSTSVTLENGKAVDSKYVTLLKNTGYTDRWMYMRSRGLMSPGANDGVDHYAVDYLCDFSYRFVMMNAFGRIY